MTTDQSNKDMNGQCLSLVFFAGIRRGWIHHFRTSWAYPDDTIRDDADTPTLLAPI
jgi:hypothetical protein